MHTLSKQGAEKMAQDAFFAGSCKRKPGRSEELSDDEYSFDDNCGWLGGLGRICDKEQAVVPGSGA